MSRIEASAVSTAMPGAGAPRRTRVVNTGDRTFIGLLTIAGLSVLGVAALIVGVLWHNAQPAFAKFGLGFVTGTDWDPVQESFGALPFIYGTVVTSALALLVAVPVALGMALFVTEMSSPRVRSAVAFMLTSITLSINASRHTSAPSVLQGIKSQPVKTQPAQKPVTPAPTQK